MEIKGIFRRKQYIPIGQEEMRECPSCKGEFSSEKIIMGICPQCGHYFSMTPKQRIELVADSGSFRKVQPLTLRRLPLYFPGYAEKLQMNREKTGNRDAVVTGTCRIEGRTVAIGIMDGRFFMGSMGSEVGEQISALAEYATAKKLPLIIFSVSGGARMQEGMFSLMQMAKTAAAIQRFKEKGGLYISVMTNPTSGGVTASFASLGDINIAEPGALICFAGPRVIQQTIRQTLPEGFQKSEFLLDHGMLDDIVPRQEQRSYLARLLRLHTVRKGIGIPYGGKEDYAL